MIVLSDTIDYAAELLPQEAVSRLSSESVPDPAILPLIQSLYEEGVDLLSTSLPDLTWRYLFLSECTSHSQYDQMIELARSTAELPDRILCLAGSGSGLHGYKGRGWSAVAGNIHLTVHLTPKRPIERFETAFTILAALSVVDAIDGVPGLESRARIKWVNDILIDGAKVAGILAYTQTRERTVSSAVLGIGLNVETAPTVDPTPFVPSVGSVRDFAPDALSATQGVILDSLLNALARNYQLLLEEGYTPLLERYRERAGLIGSKIAVCSEDSDSDPSVIAEGRVVAMGEGLELYLENRDEPVTKGRLILGNPESQKLMEGFVASKGR
ncbi:biotin--[acetyl-CoA-carboxylase] ligase [Gemmatimonadota bacterium]